MPLRLISLACLLAGGLSAASATAQSARLLQVEKIWDQAPHNAFTDLIRWRGQFVCAFREGRGHVSTDGAIRVLSSVDGLDWTSTARIELAGYDLRDASLSNRPDGRLMLLGGACPRKRDGQSAPTGSFVAFADKIDQWTQPTVVVPPGRWLWRLTWSGDTAWGVAYAAPDRAPYSELLKTVDGQHFQTHVEQLLGKGRPTEAAIRFDGDGMMVCLHRRDGQAPANTAMLGVSSPPYDQWTWNDLGMYFGGPNLIRSPSGRWIAAGRQLTDEGPRTVLAQLDVDNALLTPVLTLPSGGDTSYPGLAFDGDELLVSYYSSHEEKTSIYMARILFGN